ncbi:predicted protein [Naegleria gruberi]|uniref:Predicted protein n=1 Tax=Naegleria gruberi TaxID=5762 RepID=D2VR38_NAEGR|nr:uncharacterized protein NAEGRDRAFT_71450 [Naegleria gruberi]EFC40740.1 predicted protein [Naegleria gruberi]|eukprot:XP_002673484.1 predicted protein [Naegleria gruberi strain NEG-M]
MQRSGLAVFLSKNVNTMMKNRKLSSLFKNTNMMLMNLPHHHHYRNGLMNNHNNNYRYFHNELFGRRNNANNTTSSSLPINDTEEEQEQEDPQVSQNVDEYNSRLLTFLLIGTPLAYLALLELTKWFEEVYTDSSLMANKLSVNDLERIFDQFTLKNGAELCKAYNINMLDWIQENEWNWFEKDFQKKKATYALYAMHAAGFVGCFLLKRFNPGMFKRFYDRHVAISLNNMYERRFHTLILGQFAHTNVLSLLIPLICLNNFSDIMENNFSQASLLALYFVLPALACMAHSSLGALMLRYLVSPSNRVLQYRIAKMGQFNIIQASFYSIFFAPIALTLPDFLMTHAGITNLELSYILFGLQFLYSIISKGSPFMVAELFAFYGSYFALNHLIEREGFQRSRIVELEKGFRYYLGERVNIKNNGMAIFIPDNRETLELAYYKNDKKEKVIKTKTLLGKDYTE